MSTKYKNILIGASLVPNSSDLNSIAGDLNFSTSTNNLYLHNGTTSAIVATSSNTLTFTNKTLTSPVINTATADTITGISGGDITIAAAASHNIILNAATGQTILNKVNGTTVSTTSSTGITLASAATITLTNNSQTVSLSASSTASASYVVTFPDAAPTSNTALAYNGTNYAWSSLLSNPMTTGGDIIYGGSGGTPTRLPNGTAGQLLSSNGGTSAPSWFGSVWSIGQQYTPTITSTQAGWTTTRSVAVVYQTVDGAWRMTFNIVGSVTSYTSSGPISITFQSTTVFKNVTSFFQTITNMPGGAGGVFSAGGYVNPNTGDVTLYPPSVPSNITGYYVSGDVELDSQPSWAT